jgi:hypothetical protein
MAAQLGRTVNKFVDFRIKAFGGTLRSIPVNSVNGVGLTYPEVDLTAFQDAMKGVLLGTPDCKITIAGPFDNSAVQTAGTLSGSHTVLDPLNGALTPCTVDVQIGMRHVWEAGEPQFGITSTATSGFLVTSYIPDPTNGTYTATLALYPGSSAPAWGTAAET